MLFYHYVKKLFPDKFVETENIFFFFFFPLPERFNLPFPCPNVFLITKILGKSYEVQHIIQRSGGKSHSYFLGYGDQWQNLSRVLVTIEGTPLWAESSVSATAHPTLWHAAF